MIDENFVVTPNERWKIKQKYNGKMEEKKKLRTLCLNSIRWHCVVQLLACAMPNRSPRILCFDGMGTIGRRYHYPWANFSSNSKRFWTIAFSANNSSLYSLKRSSFIAIDLSWSSTSASLRCAFVSRGRSIDFSTMPISSSTSVWSGSVYAMVVVGGSVGV